MVRPLILSAIMIAASSVSHGQDRASVRDILRRYVWSHAAAVREGTLSKESAIKLLRADLKANLPELANIAKSRSEGEHVRERAIEMLGHFSGRDALSDVLPLLDDRVVFRAAINYLAQYPNEKAVPRLAQTLDAKDNASVARAAEVLTAYPYTSALRALESRLGKHQGAIVAWAMAKSKSRHRALHPYLQDPDIHVRTHVFRALTNNPSKESAAVCIAAMHEVNWSSYYEDPRKVCIAYPKETLPILRKHLKTLDEPLLIWTIQTLIAMNRPEGVTAARQALRHADNTVQSRAAHELRTHHMQASLKWAANAAKSKAVEDRKAAGVFLQGIWQTADGFPTLKRLFVDKDPEVRELAVRGIYNLLQASKIPVSVGEPYLHKALASSERDIRKGGIFGLRFCPTETARAALEKAAKADPESALRWSAQNSLQTMRKN